MQTNLFMLISEMRKFLFKLSLLAIILTVCDILIGKTMVYVVDHIYVGAQGRDNYICNLAKEDVLIFGSSRAVHHYNSSVIEDELGLTTYNCGEDGNGIILAYGRLMMIKERHQPKLIIYDVNPNFDLYEGDNSKYLGWLRHRYDRDGISNIFDECDPTEKYKMWSSMYQYNSTFLQNLFTFFTSISHDTGIKGFRPLNGTINKKIISGQDEHYNNIDRIKLSYVEKFIKEAKGTKLIFVVSPLWDGMDRTDTEAVKEICKSNNEPFLDFSNDTRFLHHNEYFKDVNHLNKNGANFYSKQLKRWIQKL